MNNKKILFVSWQGGMGHVTRDVAIAQELKHQVGGIDIDWLAHPLACKVLNEAGEKILPEAIQSTDYSALGVSTSSGGFKLNIFKYMLAIKKGYDHNVEIFKQVVAKHPFDLIIGDECYELRDALIKGKLVLDNRLLMIQDFLGLEAMSWNPLERVIVYLRNRMICQKLARIPETTLTHLFVGELEDIPNKPFGFFLENRRAFAKKHLHFLGNILRFNPADYTDKEKIRAKLGYGKAPLIICATGGTCIGKELIELCGQAYPFLKEMLPDLKLVLVCGELFGSKPPSVPEGITVHGYLPRIYEHFAACDLAVVVGGGTSTLELAALRRPFIYFPLEGQFDQQLLVAERLTRWGAGIKMRYHQTTPASLAKTILAHIGQEASWPSISIDGAVRAARLIVQYLQV